MPSPTESLPKMMTYRSAECAVFLKTGEKFGGLSNMAPGYPVFVNGTRILTTEHLYQCCRFPDHPEVQRLILAEKSPMAAKMRSKPHRSLTRSDWEGHDGVRVEIMRWCLGLKLAQNWDRFRALLLETGKRPIVEESHKDRFWGAVPTVGGAPDLLVGQNVLGTLLSELRDKLTELSGGPPRIQYPAIRSFNFLGQPIR